MKIHYIQPYSVEKNIGKAINDAIDQITEPLGDCEDDWIVLTDHDMMWLLPDSKAQVERILNTTDYGILGCMTNRIRSKEQLVGGLFNENDQIREHIKIAEKCRENAGDHIKPAYNCVAAFMMCFRVSVWTQIGGFVKGVINFDRLFCDEARKICNAKIGIMSGVYVFHGYRMWSNTPLKEYKHLIKT